MFTRDSNPPRIDTLIGKAAHLRGDMEFAGGLHLDGHIEGGVRATAGAEATLSVSPTGTITGKVEVPNVLLEGRVKGDIHARERVVLGATARVEGNLYYGVIEMTLGAQIMGKLVRLTPETPPAVAAGKVKPKGAGEPGV
jgi:cytoskeletal protein CcmA (bactofilin family)